MMNASQAAQARRSLDKRLVSLGPPGRFAVPRSGWVRAVRESLGMTATALGRRLGVSGQAVTALEASEVNGRARIDSLRRAAEAMDCVFVYALLPRTSLEATVRDRATQLALRQMQATARSMALEDQAAAVDEETIRHHADRILAAGEQWREWP